MRPATSRRRALLGGIALTFVLASCGASGGQAEQGTTSTSAAKTTTTRARATTTSERGTTTTADRGPTKAQLETFIETVLLTPEEVGVDGLVASSPTLSPSAPCGLNLEKEFPSLAKGSTVLTSDNKGVALQESIRVYATEADASDAYEAVLDTGLGCSESADGSIKIAPLGDVSTAVAPPGVDLQAESFSLDSAEYQGTAIAIHYSDSLVVVQVVNRPGASELGGLPDPEAITRTAMAKIHDSIPG